MVYSVLFFLFIEGFSLLNKVFLSSALLPFLVEGCMHVTVNVCVVFALYVLSG